MNARDCPRSADAVCVSATPAHMSTVKQHHQQTEEQAARGEAHAGVLFTSKRTRYNYLNMSGFDENPFVDAVDVNPFQVINLFRPNCKL